MGASYRYLKQFLAIVLQQGFPFSKENEIFTLCGMRCAPQSISVSEKLVTRQAFLRGTPQLRIGPPPAIPLG